MVDSVPAIIVTGASGFVGRHFLDAAKDEYTVYALARRSQREAGIADHPNIKWIQVDIANWAPLKAVMANIKRQGGVDYVYHLAGYYDFTYRDHSEYQRTNVNGTRHMLELAKWLCVKRFIFASSLAACSFSRPGVRVTEQTPPDADFAYAHSKRIGEEMVREFSGLFPCSIVRFAAVYSEWCEYVPLYSLLSTWLSHSWKNRILGGRGESAITYIHVDELTRMIQMILRQSGRLPAYGIYLASPDGSTSHAELYEIASRFFYGRLRQPICMPRIVAYPGLILMSLVGRLTQNPPFERPWMLKYVDRKLTVDSSHTRKALGWAPAPRSHVLRRVLFLIEKMKSLPEEWRLRNEAAMKRVSVRPNLTICEELVSRKGEILAKLTEEIVSGGGGTRFRQYQLMEPEERRRHFSIFYDLLLASVRTGNRMLLFDYVKTVAPARFEAGFGPAELCAFFWALNELILSEVRANPKLECLEQEARDYIGLSLQIASDEVELAHAELAKEEHVSAGQMVGAISSVDADDELARMVERLNLFYQPYPAEEGMPEGTE